MKTDFTAKFCCSSIHLFTSVMFFISPSLTAAGNQAKLFLKVFCLWFCVLDRHMEFWHEPSIWSFPVFPSLIDTSKVNDLLAACCLVCLPWGFFFVLFCFGVFFRELDSQPRNTTYLNKLLLFYQCTRPVNCCFSDLWCHPSLVGALAGNFGQRK